MFKYFAEPCKTYLHARGKRNVTIYMRSFSAQNQEYWANWEQAIINVLLKVNLVVVIIL